MHAHRKQSAYNKVRKCKGFVYKCVQKLVNYYVTVLYTSYCNMAAIEVPLNIGQKWIWTIISTRIINLI